MLSGIFLCMYFISFVLYFVPFVYFFFIEYLLFFTLCRQTLDVQMDAGVKDAKMSMAKREV